jgi:hypothetical protein
MMEFAQFYVSSFWIWAGITFGVWMLFYGIAISIAAMKGRGP